MQNNDHDDDASHDIFGELVPIGGSDDARELALGLSNVASSISASGVGSGLPFLGLSKGGFWQYGSEGVRPDPTATLAVNLRSAKHGFIAWKEGKPYDRMVAANQPLPPASELPNYGVEWQLCLSVEMVFLTGKDKGVQVVYKNNSVGGRKALAKLYEQVGRQLQVDPSKKFPIVKLGTYAYDNKKFGGETTNPVFELVGFTDGRTQIAASAAASAAASGPEPEPQADAGARRRRVGT